MIIYLTSRAKGLYNKGYTENVDKYFYEENIMVLQDLYDAWLLSDLDHTDLQKSMYEPFRDQMTSSEWDDMVDDITTYYPHLPESPKMSGNSGVRQCKKEVGTKWNNYCDFLVSSGWHDLPFEQIRNLSKTSQKGKWRRQFLHHTSGLIKVWIEAKYIADKHFRAQQNASRSSQFDRFFTVE